MKFSELFQWPWTVSDQTVLLCITIINIANHLADILWFIQPEIFRRNVKENKKKTFEVLKRWKRLLSIWKGSLCSNGIVYLIHDCALTWKHKSSQIQWTVKDENKIEKSFKKWKSLSDLKKYFRSFDLLLLWSLAQSSLLIRISSLENGFRALIFNKLRTN